MKNNEAHFSNFLRLMTNQFVQIIARSGAPCAPKRRRKNNRFAATTTSEMYTNRTGRIAI